MELDRVVATCERPSRRRRAAVLGEGAWGEGWSGWRAPRGSWRGDENRHERREAAGEAAPYLLWVVLVSNRFPCAS